MFRAAHFFNKSHLIKWLLFLLISFLSWNYLGFLFIINLVILFDFISKVKDLHFRKYLILSFIYIFLWHLGALGWLIWADQGIYGLILSVVVYLIPFILFYFLSKYYYKLYFFLVIFLMFEVIINTISFSNPLLTIGNSLSNQIYLIQWYKYTTVIGGSVWLLTISYLIYQLTTRRSNIALKSSLLIVIVIPVLFSIGIFNAQDRSLLTENKKIISFNPKHYEGEKDNINIALHLYHKLRDTSNVDYLLIPEATFKFESMNFQNTVSFKTLKKLINESKIKNIFLGSKIKTGPKTYINCGILLRKDRVYLKIKRKLVPFTEKVPKLMQAFYSKESIVDNFTDDSVDIEESFSFLPLICYEAFYPNFSLQKKIKTTFTFILSSEEFIKSSYFGNLQILNFMKLRGIETQNPLIKASSFGFSCILNKKGEIIKKDNKNEFSSFSLY